MSVYSSFKPAWHLDRIADLRAGRQAAPVNIQLIPSDYCNQDCFYCAYRASNGLSSAEFSGVDKVGNRTHNPLRMVPREKLLEILTDAARLGVKSVTWTGGGEPTAHPNHMELFAYALELGLECSLNTNGVVLRQNWRDVLPRFTYVRFSFDGSNAQQYAAIRGAPMDAFDKVLGNINSVVQEIKTRQSACVVGAGYVVTPEYHASTPQAVALLREAGLSYVRLASMQSADGVSVYGDQLAAASESVRKACSLARPGFDVVNLFESGLGKRMTDPFCGFQQLVLYVGGNQKIYRCCYVAYSQAGEIGDLRKQSLRDWFESEAKQQAIANFDARSCNTCPLLEKNATIASMLKAPPHVNFL